MYLRNQVNGAQVRLRFLGKAIVTTWILASGLWSPNLQAKDLPSKDREKFFSRMSQQLQAHEKEVIQILTRVENFHGAKFEVEQAIALMESAFVEQEEYFREVQGLHKVLSFVSDQRPLLSFITYGIIPAAVSDHVVMQTSSQIDGVGVFPADISDVYKRIFELIKTAMPEIDWTGIQLVEPISESSQEKKWLKETLTVKSQRPDAILFSGNLRAGAKLQSDVEEILAQSFVSSHETPIRLLLLQMGEGLHPMVVSAHSSALLSDALNRIRKAIQINSGQDFQAPQFIGVQDGLKDSFLSRLRDLLEQLSFVKDLASPEGDYSQVTRIKRFTAYQKFRERYFSFLLNPTAVIEEQSGRIDPHFFFFPPEEFKKLNFDEIGHSIDEAIQSPFFILFGYNNSDQLEELLAHPAFQERAVTASLFGDRGDAEVRAQRGGLERARFSVRVNPAALNFHSSEPYGAFGSPAASITWISSSDSRGQLTSESYFQPVLFAREARRFFKHRSLEGFLPAVGPADPISDQVRSEFERMYLDEDAAKRSTDRTIPKIADLPFSERPHGIAFLREVIQRDGLTRITSIDLQKPTPAEIEAAERLYGTRVLFPNPLWDQSHGRSPVSVKGVLLHSPPSGMDSFVFNLARGEVNPQLGRGSFVWLIQDRVFEHHVLNSIWPGIVAPSASFGQLSKEGILSSELLGRIRSAKELVNQMIKAPSLGRSIRIMDLEDRLGQIVRELLDGAKKKFPKGAYIKNYGEFGTGDHRIQITTMEAEPKRIVNDFISRFEEYLDSTQSNSHFSQYAAYEGYRTIDDAYFVEFFQQDIDKHRTGAKLLFQILHDYSRILANQKLRIQKTPHGQNLEIRVDYVDGEPISAHGHFSSEYLREEETEAKEVMRQFFLRSGGLFSQISGGADVAKLEDGTWAIIEMNVGGTSGSTIATVVPVMANEFVSELQGYPTYLMSLLEATYQQGPLVFNQFLRSLKVERRKRESLSLDDLSISDVGRWVRDRALDDFGKAPTLENYHRTLKQILQIFENVGSVGNTEIAAFVDGAKDYMKIKIGLNRKVLQER